MNYGHLIKKQLCKIGVPIYLQDGEWTSMPFHAMINYLWRKKSSSFEPNATPIGLTMQDYYLYIGPKDHDILALSDDALVICGDRKYTFSKRDAVRIDDEVYYYSAILKKVEETEYEEY